MLEVRVLSGTPSFSWDIAQLVELGAVNSAVARSSRAIPAITALLTELVYVLVLEARFCGFESRAGHQIFLTKMEA